MMSAKTEIAAARDAILTVLDGKLGHLPEWKVFRAVDRALIALSVESPKDPVPVIQMVRPLVMSDVSVIRPARGLSYGDIAFNAIFAASKPMTTLEIVEQIESHRQTKFDDIERAKVNVTSSLSRDPRLESINWQGGKAWWLTHDELPVSAEGQSAREKDMTSTTSQESE
jgi:hypothetical protein